MDDDRGPTFCALTCGNDPRQTGSGKTHTVFGPPGCLTEAAVASAAGGVPREWGLFPRIVLEILAAGLGTVHASAIEVYQERAFDLLADRAPLTVGGKSAGVKVGGSGPALVNPYGKGPGAYEGTHPKCCQCGKCIVANEKAREAMLEMRKDREEAARLARSAPRGARGGGRSRAAAAVLCTAATLAEDESFATVGETVVPLASAADVARLARTIEARGDGRGAPIL